MRKIFNLTPMLSNAKWLWSLLTVAALFCLFLFLGSAFLAQDQKERLMRWAYLESAEVPRVNNCLEPQFNKSSKPPLPPQPPPRSRLNNCESRCRPPGSEALPDGIVCKTSDLEMQALWGWPKKKGNFLFTVPVGIKQKETVDKMVKKFFSSKFAVMLFHYDGFVDRWKDLEWCDLVVHISAVNQTKWWFAKRFLHPDIVSQYDYIFLWDEDLGVEDFNPERYLKIVKEEGLEISQPALDPTKSEMHHQITARVKREKVHRRIYKPGNDKDRCDANSTKPPCTGWIEVMAPVFSRAAWRCTWYMIQNDFIHAWGLDTELGYCAQGDRTKNVGVVDSEYIVHYGLPTLGENAKKEESNTTNAHTLNRRVEVRRQSYKELKLFRLRWEQALKHDKCWVDPYP